MNNEITPVVKQLLIINILCFIGSQIIGDQAYKLLSLFYFENQNFMPWQVVTHMFMHADIYKTGTSSNLVHILFNMMALFSFGSLLEKIWGGKKFLFFYLSCGIGAALIHQLANYYFVHQGITHLNELGFGSQVFEILKTGNISYSVKPSGLDEDLLVKMYMSYHVPAVGASGAIYGLLVAFTFLFPNAQLSLMFIPVPIKAKYFVPIYMLLYDGFFGVFGNSLAGINSGVAHFAHLGGALIGFIMMWYWKKNSFNNKRWN